jgi:hypothetical protein
MSFSLPTDRFPGSYNIDALVDRITALESNSVAFAAKGVAAGYRIARGEDSLDGSNPTPIATGLTTVIAFVAMLKGSAAPGDGTSVLTSVITGAAGNVDVHGWKNTGGTDPTLVASTGTDVFYWIAVGT